MSQKQYKKGIDPVIFQKLIQEYKDNLPKRMKNDLANLLLHITKAVINTPSWRYYSPDWKCEMESNSLLELIQNIHKYEPTKDNNNDPSNFCIMKINQFCIKVINKYKKPPLNQPDIAPGTSMITDYSVDPHDFPTPLIEDNFWTQLTSDKYKKVIHDFLIDNYSMENCFLAQLTDDLIATNYKECQRKHGILIKKIDPAVLEFKNKITEWVVEKKIQNPLDKELWDGTENKLNW